MCDPALVRCASVCSRVLYVCVCWYFVHAELTVCAFVGVLNSDLFIVRILGVFV